MIAVVRVAADPHWEGETTTTVCRTKDLKSNLKETPVRRKRLLAFKEHLFIFFELIVGTGTGTPC